MNIILTMTLSSSVLFLLYVIMSYFYRDVLSPQLEYFILKASLLYSLVPFGYIKYMKNLLLHKFSSTNRFAGFEISSQMQTLMVAPKGYYPNITYSKNLLIIGIWLSIAIIIFVLCLRGHLKCRRNILKVTQKETSDDILVILHKYQETLKIKRNVTIYMGDESISPFTIGILRPIIVMPKSLPVHKQELVIHHELCHIKRHDGFVKFLQILVVGIYWFNPLVYFLDICLDNACEQSCDEIVTRDMSNERCRQYGRLILDMASIDSMRRSTHVLPFSNSKNIVKKRIILIMSKKRKIKKSVMLLSIGMMIVSSFPAFAYQKPIHIVWENQPEENIFLEGYNQEVSFKERNGNYVAMSNINPIIYDEQFIDQSGNIYPIEDDGNGKRKCDKHEYIDGIYEKHTKNKDGSCITRSYNCQRCSKCGILKLGSMINENTNTNCPH